MAEQTWETAITKVEPNRLTIRGYRLEDLLGRVSFAEAIYLILKGELPAPPVGRLMEAILVASIDHGPTPPSTLAARTAASTGAPLNAALAAGVLSINRHHGGAIEACLQLLQKAVALKRDSGRSVAETAAEMVQAARREGRRLPGYGHRIHTADPRTQKLLALAREAGIEGDFVEMARAIEAAIARETGKNLPLNVDGAIAALLCELEFPAELANAIFMMARLPGLTAHVYEEITTQKPMRRISPTAHVYCGPAEKTLAPDP